MGLLPTPTFDGMTQVVIALSWDKKTKPTDLDIQCCLFDSAGLMIDACFYNNRSACRGGMVLSGDSGDGAASGADEMITIDFELIPRNAYAIVCGVYCTGQGTFGDCSNIGVMVARSEGGSLAPLVANQNLTDLDSATGILVCCLQRLNPKEWQANVQHMSFKAPCRNFVDALPAMQKLLRVDPAMQAELSSRQPVFNLKKGDAAPVPMGLSEVAFGLGWTSGTDVDGSVVCLDQHKQPTALVYFGNQRAFDGAIEHSGDNRTGEGAGDDEVICLHLSRIPAETTHCFLTINVYSSKQDFRDVKDEFVRIFNNNKASPDFGKEFLRYGSLDSNGANNGVVLGCLYRDRQFPLRWKFAAISLAAKGRTCKDLVDECQELLPRYQ